MVYTRKRVVCHLGIGCTTASRANTFGAVRSTDCPTCLPNVDAAHSRKCKIGSDFLKVGMFIFIFCVFHAIPISLKTKQQAFCGYTLLFAHGLGKRCPPGRTNEPIWYAHAIVSLVDDSERICSSSHRPRALRHRIAGPSTSALLRFCRDGTTMALLLQTKATVVHQRWQLFVRGGGPLASL